MASVEIVVAIARNFVIGKDKKIPWHLSDDLKHFKAVTVPHPIVMGRRTFESVGRVLPQRENVVVTRAADLGVHDEHLHLVPSLQAAIELFKDSEKIMITGGFALYKEALALTDVIHLTRINRDFEGDTFFPDFSHLNFRLENKTEHFAPDLECSYSFETWAR